MATQGIWVFTPGTSSLKYEWFESWYSDTPSIRDEKTFTQIAELGQLINVLRPADVYIVRFFQSGAEFSGPVVITEDSMAVLETYRELAPRHNGVSLSLLQVLLAACTRATLVAVSDNDFFRDLPERATRYGLPTALTSKYGLRRKGFHGFAHDAMRAAWERTTHLKHYRLVTIQLGSDCSMAAIVDGHPVDTTMGFTVNEGLLMGTRCGDIDPGLVTWLQRREHWTPDETDRVLNEESGLFGVSGISDNIGVLEEHPLPSAQQAIELFSYRIRKTLGAYYAVLGGFDGIVISGGIAENLVPFCTGLLRGLEHLRIFLLKGQAYPDSYLHGESLRVSVSNTPVRCEIVRNNESHAVLEYVAESRVLQSA